MHSSDKVALCMVLVVRSITTSILSYCFLSEEARARNNLGCTCYAMIVGFGLCFGFIVLYGANGVLVDNIIDTSI